MRYFAFVKTDKLCGKVGHNYRNKPAEAGNPIKKSNNKQDGCKNFVHREKYHRIAVEYSINKCGVLLFGYAGHPCYLAVIKKMPFNLGFMILDL